MPCYPLLEGQSFLIVDAVLLLSLLVSHRLQSIKPFWVPALFGLCWSVIVVATDVLQQIR